jgi:hypothetical protein
MIIDHNPSNINPQGIPANIAQPFSRKDLCDISEAIGAVLRAVSFKEDHTRTILAALAEADGRTTEFSVPAAALGSRLKNSLESFVKPDELESRGKANVQRWRRAIEKLNKDQDASGFYFVRFRPGSSDLHGRNYPSRMTVDVETFVDTLRLARHRDDYETKRKFAFEEAAKSVLQAKSKTTVKRIPPRKMNDDEKLHRLEKTLVNSARNLAKMAAAQNFDAEALEALETKLLDRVRLAFHQEMAGLQNDTPEEPAEVDTVSFEGVSELSDQPERPPEFPQVKEQGNSGGGDVTEATLALEAFDSVGAFVYEVTLKDEATGKVTFHDKLDRSDLKKRLREFVGRTEQRAESFIIRPHGGAFIQLDDCSPEVVKRFEPYAFLIFETSPGNYQVWFAFNSEGSEEELKSIRSRLLAALEGTGANGGAFGAMRWPGSINRKPSRNGFRVRLHRVNLEAICSLAELGEAGLLASLPPTPTTRPVVSRWFRSTSSSRPFPSYDQCLDVKGGDRSKADASFLKLCELRGFSMAEATAELERVSERAQEERRRGRNDYVTRTWNYVTSH